MHQKSTKHDLIVYKENLRLKLSHKKLLVKLTPGVNFINALQATFARTDPKSAEKAVKLLVFFVLSGSAGSKAAHRTLMKLNPGIC